MLNRILRETERERECMQTSIVRVRVGGWVGTGKQEHVANDQKTEYMKVEEESSKQTNASERML